jgi:nicotinate-nucleotide pyrophosphorylase (carboxylating)
MLDLQSLDPLLLAALDEDIGPGDVTARLLVPEGARGKARIRAKASGIVAGLPVAARVLELAGEVSVRLLAADGQRVDRDGGVLEAEGDAAALLRGERTALNFLGRMSGVATLTGRFVEAVEGTGASILDTRKTTPGWRRLEKYAVRAGGGVNHRFALYDAVLVKENHLAFGADLARALASRPAGMEAIVEAESLEEFRVAMEAGADVVMLDEFTPDDVRRARDERGDRARPHLEVSGGITLENVRAYAEAGAERISIGALTHSAPALDLSMLLAPVT